MAVLGAIGSVTKCFSILEQRDLFGAGRTCFGPRGDVRGRDRGKKAVAGMQFSNG